MPNRATDWRTTAAGVISAVVTVALPLIQAGTVDLKTVAVASGLAAIGYLARDAHDAEH